MPGSRKPRLLVATSTYPRWKRDGEPGFVHELCRRLTHAFDVRVVTSAVKGAAAVEVLDGVDVRRFSYAPARMQTLVYGGGIVGNVRASPWKALLLPGYLLAFVIAVRGQLRDWSPQLVHAHWFVPSGLVARMALMSSPVPLVVTAHGSDVFGLRGRAWARIRRWIADRSNTLTAVGLPLADQLHDETGRVVTVIPMGADVEETFVPPAVPARERTLLVVGRLGAAKNPSTAIRAFHEVARRHPALRLEVVGDGPMLAELIALVDECGLADRVSFVGRLDHARLACRFQTALATVVASGGADAPEGLGLVAIESLACGCPVVSAPNEALRATLPAGAPVYFAADGSARSIAAEIEAVADVAPSAAPPGETGWLAALRSSNGWRAIAARFETILLEVAGR